MADTAKKQENTNLTISDKVLAKTFLPFIPRFIEPNYLTILRIILCPFVFYFLLTEQYGFGLIVFAIAAFTDALDGAIARVEDRITRFGEIVDPLADKILIGGAALILISHFLGWLLAGAIVGIELILIGFTVYKIKTSPNIKVSAKWPGKIKMIFQCFGVLALLAFAFSHFWFWQILAVIFLFISILFALWSLFSYHSI